MGGFTQGGVPLIPGCGGSTGELPSPEAIKCHRTTLLDSVVTSTWTDFTSLTKVLTESNGTALSLNEDGKTIEVSKKGLYQFGGCVHVQNNSVGIFTGVSVLTRIFKNGTTEALCSQREFTKSIASGGADVLSYNGTDFLNVEDTLTLQYWTDQASLEFFSNSNFASQIACTLWLNYLGDF